MEDYRHTQVFSARIVFSSNKDSSVDQPPEILIDCDKCNDCDNLQPNSSGLSAVGPMYRSDPFYWLNFKRCEARSISQEQDEQDKQQEEQQEERQEERQGEQQSKQQDEQRKEDSTLRDAYLKLIAVHARTLNDEAKVFRVRVIESMSGGYVGQLLALPDETSVRTIEIGLSYGNITRALESLSQLVSDAAAGTKRNGN